ncbi:MULTISPECIES: hypothetical protein [Gordonia]|uniref:Mce-associated membrane protein n=2 Tax=Gordonia alkanivorans TaxID=84096 RepID=F9VPQ3_9ACTN|nr:MULTISPECIES: hypothetical protein [Gordonia]ETA05239.1 hypothetical protein V525_20050 [Gordonia alkanivorans CGMCC 6845]MDH3007856.1 hypothetical protein [Gordonia alkanivorans]MDH3016783.1 hypothetical protein [Gordonia alkanivorans]MDH3026425.1 hypothetical protein [Gordonia alkanivorans]MDH3042028.1 hypothetical protein [Gordonia alkanivorans]
MPKPRQTSDAPDATTVTPDVEDGVTPLDGDHFLQANRTNREKYRAEAEAKAAKAARRAARRGEAVDADAALEGTIDSDETIAKDRSPRKLDPAAASGKSDRWTGWATSLGKKTWAVVALVAVAVILAASTAVLAVAYVDADRRADTAAGAIDSTILDTARKYAAEITTYNSADYSDLDRRIREISTPAFTQTYIESSQDARKGSTEAAAVSTAKADNAGIMSLDDEKAVVLVTLDQAVKSPQTAQEFPDGFPYQTRVKVTLVQQDGRWLMDDFAVL